MKQLFHIFFFKKGNQVKQMFFKEKWSSPLKESGHLEDDLFIERDYQKIYLLHDIAHLIKNIRNDLLNYNNASYFQHLNTMVLKIQFHLKVVKFVGNYSAMFLK